MQILGHPTMPATVEAGLSCLIRKGVRRLRCARS